MTSPETNNQPPAPKIYGIVSPEEAMGLNPGEPVTADVLTRLGAPLLEDPNQEPSFALVVGKDEATGEDKPLYYVTVDHQDLGTTVRKPENMEYIGLPPLEDAYNTLTAQPEDAQKQATTTEVAPETDMSGEAPSALDELSQNPDRLLHADHLKTVLDAPASMVTPDIAADAQKMANLESLRHMAKLEIVAPEAAAQVSSEIMQQAGQEVVAQIHSVDKLLGGTEDRLVALGRDGMVLAEELPQVKGAIRQLREVMSNPRYMQPDDLVRLNRTLHGFAENYTDWQRKHTNKKQDATDGARNLYGTVNNSAETVHSVAGRHATITAEVHANPDGVQTDKAIAAVRQRGAGSISEHKSSAEAEVSRNDGALRYAAGSFSELQDTSGRLVGMMGRFDSEIRYPQSRQVGDVVTELDRYIRGIASGNTGYVRMADEMLDQMSRVVARIEAAGGEEAHMVRSMRDLVETMRSDVSALRISGIA